jgi:hypothetical protein
MERVPTAMRRVFLFISSWRVLPLPTITSILLLLFVLQRNLYIELLIDIPSIFYYDINLITFASNKKYLLTAWNSSAFNWSRHQLDWCRHGHLRLRSCRTLVILLLFVHCFSRCFIQRLEITDPFAYYVSFALTDSGLLCWHRFTFTFTLLLVQLYSHFFHLPVSFIVLPFVFILFLLYST